MSVQDQSLKSLFAELIGDISQLVRQELRLARAEATEKAAEIQTGLIAIVTGILMAFSALLILLQALVIALSNLMPPSLAAIVVGLVVCAIAVFLMVQGQSRLKAANLVPERTMESIKSDKNMIAEKVR